MTDVLIGTYTDALPQVRGSGDGIHGARLDGAALGPVSVRVATPNPSYLAVSSDGGFVYAVDEVGGTLAAFSRTFASLGVVVTNGAAPCHVALSPDERYVLVSHYGSGSVSVHERLQDGSLGGTTAYVRHADGGRAHMVCADPLGASLLVPDLVHDTVFGYRLTGDGSLIEIARLALPAGTGPRHVAFSDSADHLYVLGELANTVTTFARTSTGWRDVGAVSTLPAGSTGASTAAAIRVHGDRLFVSNRGDDSVAMFALDPLPSLLAHAAVRGRTPRDLVVVPGGAHLLVANQDSNDIAVLAIERTGLRFVSSTAAPTPVCLVVVP